VHTARLLCIIAGIIISNLCNLLCLIFRIVSVIECFLLNESRSLNLTLVPESVEDIPS
jgi:hypothetical protein